MRKIITVVCAAALATCAYAEVGSVISSFYMGYSTYRVWRFGIYRDASYVYSLYDQYNQDIFLYCFTPSGSYLWYRLADRGGSLEYGGSDRCHLGSGYLSYLADSYLRFVDTSNPFPPVGSFSVRSPGTWKANNLVWDGRYYYVNYYTDYGVFNRYTPAGALVGTWAVAGWPPGVSAGEVAFSRTFNSAAGRYLIAGGASAGYIFNMKGGYLLGSWRNPSALRWDRGAVCGNAYPSSYGSAFWCHASGRPVGRIESWAYQIDIDARGASSVLPASLGKVKAIYR